MQHPTGDIAMPDKAYAILYAEENEDIGQLYFPIKRSSPYAGMPQFFGGTKHAGESDLQTIAREAAEESNRQIAINAVGHRIHSATVGDSQYHFYIVTNYTGQHFLGALPGNDEMASITRFQVHAGETDDIHDFFRRLEISMSEEFGESETCIAFEKTLEWAQEA
jgi:8-oxo-dGTP pyrophosphatase MutT (NUDIX family)